MQHSFKTDLYRHTANTSFKSFVYAFLRIPGFRFMFLWRKAKKKGFLHPTGFFYNLLYIHFAYKYGFQIPLHTQIGKGFYIGHFGTVVINRNAIIGDNCNIAHNVTIGQTNKGSRKGVPRIGNKVWIGTGSVLVGNIQIGDNVLIAPNSYVNFDVPTNSLVLGNPGQVIQKDNTVTEGYLDNLI